MSIRRVVSRPFCVVTLLSVSLLSRALPAQQVQPGTRLRVVSTTDGVNPIAGKFVSRTADALWLTRNDRESALAVLLSEHNRVDQGDGYRHRPGRGVIGGLVGLVVGSLFASAFTPKGCTGECDSYGDGEVISALSVPLIFIPLGVYAGVKSARERWKPIAKTLLSGRAAGDPNGVRFSARFVF